MKVHHIDHRMEVRTMEYTIKRNEAFNSLEITFYGKPSEAVRDALKALKFRWHGVKKLWYGYTDEGTARAAIEGADKVEETEPVYEITTREGYMGAIAWDGSNSGRFLYGAELSQAIRDAIKRDGIKGVTVAVKTFAGGQEIKVTFKAAPSDFVSLDEYITATQGKDFSAWGWITDPDTGDTVHVDTMYAWDSEKRARFHRAAAEAEYRKMTEHPNQINDNCIDSYKMFTPRFIAKLHRIRLITNSFNRDDSNSQVDYFDRAFYEWFYIKPSA